MSTHQTVRETPTLVRTFHVATGVPLQSWPTHRMLESAHVPEALTTVLDPSPSQPQSVEHRLLSHARLSVLRHLVFLIPPRNEVKKLC